MGYYSTGYSIKEFKDRGRCGKSGQIVSFSSLLITPSLILSPVYLVKASNALFYLVTAVSWFD